MPNRFRIRTGGEKRGEKGRVYIGAPSSKQLLATLGHLRHLGSAPLLRTNMQLLSALTDDTLLLVLSDLQRGASWTRGEDVVDVVALSSVCHDARKRLAGSLEDIRTSLPPPYSPTALDVALAAGDADIQWRWRRRH